MTDPLARFIKQQALTSERLGVGFVPVARSPRAAQTAASEAPAAPPPEPPRPETPVEVIAPEPREAPRPPIASPADDAPKADRLEALRARYEADAPHADFVTDFNKIVFGEGDPDARLMFIGEAPGADEDRTGRPFVGRAGQLLEKMINAMGFDRADVYIANVLKTRPPNNQTPTSEEAAACAPYLFEQIRIVQPEAIVTLGLPAAHTLLESTRPMRDLRGRWADFPPREFATCAATIPPSTFRVMPTYHPAFLLRAYTPENRAKVWADLKQVMDALAPGSGNSPA